jgi:hypothetical protein
MFPVALQEPRSYEDSIAGFIEPKLGTLTKLLGVTYLTNVVITILVGRCPLAGLGEASGPLRCLT